MPECPTEAQSEASRLNGALSQGPKDSSNSRFNATRHGFTAGLRPPTDPEEGRFFEQLLADLAAEREPQGRIETLLLEEIANLELRRAKVQQVLGEAPAVLEEAPLRTTLLMDRYETEIKRKLTKCWERYDEVREARLAAAEEAAHERAEAEREAYEFRVLSCYPDLGDYEMMDELLNDPAECQRVDELLGPEALEFARRMVAQFKEAADLSGVALNYMHRMLPLLRSYWEERGWDENTIHSWYEVEGMRACSGSFREIRADLAKMLRGFPPAPAFPPPPEWLGHRGALLAMGAGPANAS